jgi:glycosyltransferase involved in cell wall biosynthesis
MRRIKQVKKINTMRVALIGNLAGVGYNTAKALNQAGMDVHLYIPAQSEGMALPSWDDKELSQSMPEWIHIYGKNKRTPKKGPLDKIKDLMKRETSYLKISLELLQKYDLVHAFTASLFGLHWPIIFYGILRLKPYIACATGSDIREVAALYHNVRGKVMRLFFKRASKTLLLNFDMVSLIEKFDLKRAIFFPFLIDTDRYSPQVVQNPYRQNQNEIFFFHTSHLDWGIIDRGLHRNSTKGNDRFIRAFARFIKEGGKGRLIMLYRGPDRDIARNLIKELGIEERVVWRDTLIRDELISHYNLADVVVDQFDVGSFGTTALEAMACEKPLLIYANQEYAKACYPEFPPVVNCYSEEEIYKGIIKVTDPEFRSSIGRKARQWVLKYHSKEVVAYKLLETYSEICPEFF